LNFASGYSPTTIWIETLPKANRICLIDDTGRVYDKSGVEISLVYQDNGKTLKIFIEPLSEEEKEKVKEEISAGWAESLEGVLEESLKRALATHGTFKWITDRFEKGL